MVSALSLRLMSGGNTPPYDNKGMSSSNSGNGKPKSLSGYSADLESLTSKNFELDENKMPPCNINLKIKHHNHRKRGMSDDPEQRAKKERRDEAQYIASNVRAELRRGGLPFPRLHVGTRSRVLPCSSVDMSCVKLVYSKDTASSPFLASSLSSSVGFLKESAFTEIMKAYTTDNPINQSSNRRGGNGKDANTNEDGGAGVSDAMSVTSCNSSMTLSDAESNGGENCDANTNTEPSLQSDLVAARSRPDDALEANHNSNEEKKNVKENVITMPSSQKNVPCSSSSNAISIEEALQPQRRPRLVMTSSPPYTVIYANAAYARMIGSKPDSFRSVVGKHFFQLVKFPSTQQELKEMSSLEHCAASSGNGKDLQVGVLCQSSLPSRDGENRRQGSSDSSTASTAITDNKAAVKCAMKVLAIASGNKWKQAGRSEEENIVTHYSVDLLSQEDLSCIDFSRHENERKSKEMAGEESIVGISQQESKDISKDMSGEKTLVIG